MNRSNRTRSNHTRPNSAPVTRGMRRRSLCLAMSMLLAGAAMPAFAADPVMPGCQRRPAAANQNTKCRCRERIF